MSLFHESEDGPFDVSGFPSTPTDFLRIAIPVIELAVGYGRGVGLRFFHERPQVLQTPAGPRVVSPTVTALFGMGARPRTVVGVPVFRHLVARQYDRRFGVEVARGPEDWGLYVTIATGRLRD